MTDEEIRRKQQKLDEVMPENDLDRLLGIDKSTVIPYKRLDEQVSQDAKIDSFNEDATSPFLKTKDQLEEDKQKRLDDLPPTPPTTKTPLQELLEKSNALREKSSLDMTAAKKEDQRKAMIGNLSKALGSLGAAEIQHRTGQNVGLTGFTPIQAEDSSSKILKERDNLLNQLQGEYRLMKEDTPDKSMNDYQKAQIQEAKDDRALRERLARLAASAAAAKKGKGGTKGEEAVDKDFAKEYNKFTDNGMTNAADAIKRLEKLQKEVAKDTGFGEAGGTRFPIPDMLRSRLAIERRDDARNFANATLKELFPGALSDDERKAAAQEFWNDGLSNESNSVRLENKIKTLKQGLDMKIKKTKYYENNNKSLDGWKGVSDADKWIQESSYPKMVRKDGQVAVISNSTEEEAKKEGWK